MKTFGQRFKDDKNSTNFANRIKEISKAVDDAENTRQIFLRKFAKSFIKNMSINDYIIGGRNKDSFCHWMEYSLNRLGSTASYGAGNWGIYKNNQNGELSIGNGYWAKQSNGDVKKCFHLIKRKLLELLEAGKKEDYKSIDSNPFRSNLKWKILSVYYPKKYFPIFSKKHLSNLLKLLNISVPQSIFDTESKKLYLLKEYFDKHPYFNNHSLLFCMYYLYNGDSPFRKEIYGEEEISQKKKDDNKNSVAKKVCFSHLENCIAKNNANVSNKSMTEEKYINMYAENIELGKKGEEIIKDAEISKLKKIGRNDLAEKVLIVSGENGDDSLGYDIESYEATKEGNKKIYIEVKTSETSFPKIRFYIADNELKQLKIENHYIYYLSITNNEYCVIQESDIDNALKSKTYLVSCEAKDLKKVQN